MNKELILGAVALVIAIIAVFLPQMPVSEDLGNKTASFWDAIGYKMSGTDVLSKSTAGTTTLAVNCVQTSATSTATPIKLLFNTAFTGSTTVNGDGSASGNVLWDYGTCP